LGLYNEISAQYPKAHTPKRLALNVASGEDFKVRLERYLSEWLRKGAPSLFGNVQSLCKIPEKLAAIEGLVLGFYNSLKTSQKIKDSGLLLSFFLSS